MYCVQLLELSGKFATHEHKVVSSLGEAMDVAKRYAEAQGFTKIKWADNDDPMDGMRITGTTPGGRAGRNIATVDPY